MTLGQWWDHNHNNFQNIFYWSPVYLQVVLQLITKVIQYYNSFSAACGVDKQHNYMCIPTAFCSVFQCAQYLLLSRVAHFTEATGGFVSLQGSDRDAMVWVERTLDHRLLRTWSTHWDASRYRTTVGNHTDYYEAQFLVYFSHSII